MLFAPERARPVIPPEPVTEPEPETRPAKPSLKVRRAARMLDRQCPGWAETVDLDKLRMPSPKYCVLGQLYGTYELGLSVEGLGLRRALRHVKAFRSGVSEEEWAIEVSRRRGE